MISSDMVPPMLGVKACTLFVAQEVFVCVKRESSGVAGSAFLKFWLLPTSQGLPVHPALWSLFCGEQKAPRLL